MVVGKVMRWSPWAPAKKKTQYKVKVKIDGVEGLILPMWREGMSLVVEMEWRDPPPAPSKSGTLASLARSRTKKKVAQRVTSQKAVVRGGAAQWEEFEDDGREGEVLETVLRTAPGGDALHPPEVSFTLLCGFQEQKGKRKKLENIGETSLNLAEWAPSLESLKQDGVVCRGSHLQVQRKRLPLTLTKGGLSCDAILQVTISLSEIRSKETLEAQTTKNDTAIMKNRQEQKEASDGQVSDSSSTSDSEVLDLIQLLQLADSEDKVVSYKNRNHASGTSTSTSTSTSITSGSSGSSSSSGASSPELHFRSNSVGGLLSWRKRRKNPNKVDDDKEGESQDTKVSSSNKFSSKSSKRKDSPVTKPNDDPIGSWENKEFICRDKQTKLIIQTFFASIDQRDESAGGESACTALVAVVADALYSNALNMPTKSELDALIREGSSEWRKLCENESYKHRFHNKHFDLDTILEAKIRPISIVSEKSFIGFFQPESFESLSGAMSFDDIWDEIIQEIREGDLHIYIVSWNDHFFVLKMEYDRYYLIDTLGERLFEGCNKAYILKFDEAAQIHRLPEKDASGKSAELVCSGKACCREFIKKFLAAIPLREELELEEKRKGTGNIALHQRLQIEFHLTQAFSETTNMDKIGDETHSRISFSKEEMNASQ